MPPEGNVSGCGCAANYTVNAWGQALTDANSHTMTYKCDLAGKQTEVDRQDGTRLLTGYDADGNVQSHTDGLSHATSYGYDALNRKTSMTDALSRATSYGYDAAGNLTSLTDARGQSTSYAYDAGDQLVSLSYSDNRTAIESRSPRARCKRS